MAKISLRAYNHEIGNLIDHGQTEEASAHCKYILKIFPKHLDTYRLLGKTYLESQRYSEAADILQRVLAVVPDDFVSQIGLSIIREDEGNLDAAIWNMERAFEVQPSNAAVQEELRRLYGNRDGVQPPRVRLTRGALVRMYTKGDLYQQAIAEARAAIAESPKRTDLEILLARNYYLSKNYVEATEICSRLVKKMPYCYEANLILADILPKANKIEEAKIFAKRVQELDPYAAFTDRPAAASDQVPDDAVTLEKLEWQPSMEDTEQPRWAKSIGVDIGSQADQPASDWLSDLPESTPQSSAPMPFIIPEISSSKSDESLPGWMKEDEWSTSKDSEPSGDNQSSAFIMDDAENLPEADMPDWLQSMAPDDMDQGQPAASPPPFESTSPETENAPDWMSDLNAGPPASQEPGPFSASPFIPSSPAEDEDVPEWMQDLQTGPVEEPPTEDIHTESPSGEVPDFSAFEMDDSSLDIEPQEEDTPDWLKDLEGAAGQPAMPLVESPEASELPGQSDQESEVPDWLSDMEQEETTPPPPETPEAGDQDEDIPDWLQDLEGSSGQSEEQPEKSKPSMPGVTDMLGKSSQETEVPDWLSDIEQDETIPAAQVSSDGADQADEIPDWLQDLEGSSGQTEEQPESPEVAMPGVTDMLGKSPQEPEAPDWLSDMEQEETVPAAPLPSDAAEQTGDLPDWLQDLEGSSGQAEEQPESPEVAMPGVTDMLGKSSQEPEVPDWLSDMEQEQTVPAAPLPSDAADQTGDVPDWLQDFEGSSGQAEGRPESPEVAMPGVTDMLGKSSQESEVPDWLSEIDAGSEELTSLDDDSLDSIVEQPSTEKSPQASDETPDWLQELDVIESDNEPEVEAALPAAILGAAAMLDNEKPLVQSNEEIPDDSDDAFAWLESLAAQHGADEETLSTPIEERDTAVPDWLQEMGDTSTQAASEPEIQSDSETLSPVSGTTRDETITDISMPDWLQDIDAADQLDHPDQETVPALKSQSDFVSNGKFTDWLNHLEENEPAAEKQAPDKQELANEPVGELPPAQPSPVSSLPDWLQDFSDSTESEPGQEPEITPAVDESPAAPMPVEEVPSAGISVPDWLNDLAEEGPTPSEDETQIDLPDWMQAEDQSTEKLAPAARSTSIPDWLENLKPADSLPQEAEEWQPDEAFKPLSKTEPPNIPSPAVAPDDETVVHPRKAQVEAQPQEHEEMPADADDAFAWLESLAAKHGADEEALVTAADERQETPPEWIKDLSSAEEIQPEEISPEPDTYSISDLDTGIDLLNAAEEIPTEPTLEEQQEAEAKAQQWLQALASGKSVEELAASPQDESSETAETPEKAAISSSSDEMPSDPAEAFAWLESLAAQHGADEETLSTPPEERDSTTPDWLKDIEQDLTAEPREEAASISQDSPVHAQEEPAPSDEIGLLQEEEMPADPDEAFAWLESLAAQQGADEEALSTPPKERDRTAPAWLQDIEEDIIAEEPQLESEPVAEDIFQEEEDELPAQESVRPEPSPQTTLPAWLKEFEEPLDESQQTSPEPQDETVVRWLHKMDADEQPSAESVIEPSVARSASKEVITEPVKPAEKPVAEEMPAVAEVEPMQPAIAEPAPVIMEEPVQAAAEIEEPASPVADQALEPLSEADAEIAGPHDLLAEAQKLVNKGQIEESIVIYQTLIKEETRLDAVIKDLNDALLHHPVDTVLWLTLGDAYMQKKEMQSALSAYTKAEELLH